MVIFDGCTKNVRLMCTKIMGIFRMYKVFNKNISNRFYFKHYIIDNQYSISKLLNISDKDFIKILVNINSFYTYLNPEDFKNLYA